MCVMRIGLVASRVCDKGWTIGLCVVSDEDWTCGFMCVIRVGLVASLVGK